MGGQRSGRKKASGIRRNQIYAMPPCQCGGTDGRYYIPEHGSVCCKEHDRRKRSVLHHERRNRKSTPFRSILRGSRRTSPLDERYSGTDTWKGNTRDRKSTRLNSSHVSISYA